MSLIAVPGGGTATERRDHRVKARSDLARDLRLHTRCEVVMVSCPMRAARGNPRRARLWRQRIWKLGGPLCTSSLS